LLAIQVYVQDIFTSKSAKDMKFRWRPAVITDISLELVRVHYIGLSDDWDEVLDLTTELHRIKNKLISKKSTTFEPVSTNTLKQLSKSQLHNSSSNSSSNTIHKVQRQGIASPSPTRRRTYDTGLQDSEYDLSHSRMDNIDSAIDDFVTATPKRNIRKPMTDQSSTPSTVVTSRRTSVRGVLQRHNSLKDVIVTPSDIAFEDRMEQAGMYIIPIEGDGNCLFRAVAHQM